MNTATNTFDKSSKATPNKGGLSLFLTKFQDRIAFGILSSISVLVILLLFTLIFLLFKLSLPVIKESGIDFIITDFWNPLDDEFGSLAFIYGTVLTSLLALGIAGPVSVMVALFMTEILPKKISNILGIFVEMIAAIPSIVFGLWGLFFLAPFVRSDLTPFLKKYFGLLPFFQGPSFGIGFLSASIVLAIMIIPTITSICREVFKTIPSHQKEAALALGATRFEMIKLAVLNPSFSGIMSAIVLGFGRALGETMAVAMIIGNSPTITASLFSPGATMASVIANEYAEAESELHLSAMTMIGLVLFVVTFFINAGARTIVWRYEKKRGVRR